MGRFGGGKAGRKIGGKAAVGLFRPALRWFKTAGVRTTVKRAAQATGRGLRNALKKPRNFAKRFRGRARTKDPIDIVSGEVVMQQLDVELPGVLPLTLERTHVSSYREGRWFGISWASTLDQHLETDGDDVIFFADDGMKLIYPVPPVAGIAVLPEEGPRLPLTRGSDGSYRITDRESGRSLHFASQDAGMLPLTAITDRNGTRIDLDYDEEGQLSAVRHSGGYQVAVETRHGRITALLLNTAVSNGHSENPALIRYGYDAAGHLVEVINSSGEPLRYTYDGEGRMTSWTDRNGSWYRYAYDEQGRGVRGTGSDGFLDAELAYGDGYTVVTDSQGHQTTYEINALGQVVAETDPLGNTKRTEWDRYDRPLSVTDPLGRITTYSYDESGELTTITRPDGAEITAAYDRDGNLTEISEPGSGVTRNVFDQRGNLVSVTDALGGTTRFSYDQRGALASVTDPLGHTTSVDNDRAGLPVVVRGPEGATTRFVRDALGRVITHTGPVGEATRFSRTIEGDLTSSAGPGGATERWEYDAEGNLISYTDEAGNTSRYEYTHFDLLSAETRPDGTRLEYAYDTELRLAAVTNPQGLVWRYGYDPAGNLTREVDFNGREVTYGYDAAGQVISIVNGAGQETQYVRNSLGSIIEQRSPNQVTTLSYDLAGQLTRARTPAADLKIAYDLLGRVIAETCNGRTLRSEYDLAGQRVSRVTPSNARSAWTYDPAGRAHQLHTDGQRLQFGYDVAGRETERRIGGTSARPGAILTQQWDAADHLTAQTLWGAPRPSSAGTSPRLIQHRAYTYRADGYVTAADDRHIGRRKFTLDAVGRVNAVQAENWRERYAYDSGGNLTSAAWPASVTPDDLDEAGGSREYSGTLIRRAGNVRYEHDAQGRVILRQVKTLSAKPRNWRYTWDDDDRLTEVRTPDGQHWRYVYDPLGRRIAKQRLAEDGTVLEETTFAWDASRLAEQVTTAGTELHVVTWDYEPHTHRPLAQREHVSALNAPQEWIDERFHAIVSDLTGTPAELVTPAGDLAWQSRATLWGATRADASSGTSCPLRFPGQYADPETGLHYNLHRYYDPATARYASPDPLGLAPQPNHHAYVHNPHTWIDPLGLAPYKPDPIRIKPGQQAKGGAHKMKNADERNFARDLLKRKPNLQVYRLHGKANAGDFLVIDKSNPKKWVAWAVELKPPGKNKFEGTQLANYRAIEQHFPKNVFAEIKPVSGSLSELMKEFSRGRGSWRV